jgi:hypothetical protein
VQVLGVGRFCKGEISGGQNGTQHKIDRRSVVHAWPDNQKPSNRVDGSFDEVSEDPSKNEIVLSLILDTLRSDGNGVEG